MAVDSKRLPTEGDLKEDAPRFTNKTHGQIWLGHMNKIMNQRNKLVIVYVYHWSIILLIYKSKLVSKTFNSGNINEVLHTRFVI